MKERRLIRSAALNGFTEAAVAVGLDPTAMMKEVGLVLPDADDLDRMISLDAFLTLLANCADKSGMTDFGIRVAISRDIPDLGPVSLLMREADDLEAAIRLYTSHIRLHSDGTMIQLDTRFENPIVMIEMPAPTERLSMQATQIAVARMLRQIRWLIGEDYRPELVCFSFSKPKDTQMAQRFFQCEVRYGQVLSGIVLDRTVLHHPLVTSPPFLRKLALKQLQPLLTRGAETFALKVKRLISQGLAEGEFSSEAIAEMLSIDRRTLNRRLAREGVTYSSLLQSVRMQVAQQGLANPDQSLTELSCAAGFQSLSAFSRWFQTSFGLSATAWRTSSSRGPLPAFEEL